MGPSFKEEFSWRNFSLGRFHKAEAFCEAQWRWPRLVFVLYRSLMCCYTLFGFIYILANLEIPAPHHVFMVYLTNWTYLLETLFFLWGAVLAFFHFCKPDYFSRLRARRSLPESRVDVEKSGTDNPVFVGNKTGDHPANYGSGQVHASSAEHRDSICGQDQEVATSLPWYVQVFWFLSSVIHVMVFVVTVVYFVALYSPSEGVDLNNMNVHALNSVIVIVDVCVCARPVRLLHALYPILYGLAYVIFSAIYWSQDHEKNVLYANVLDWNMPGIATGVVFGLGVVGIPLLQLVQYGVYRLRLCLYCKIYGEGYL